MKKEKKVYTPEELTIRKAARKETARLGFKEGIIPFFIQFGIVVVFILFMAFVIGNDATAHVQGVPEMLLDGRVQNDPNIIRLIYLFLCFPAIYFLLKWAGKITDRKKSFWPALVAGILLWQAVGECSRHFGLSVEGTFFFFPWIEGPQGWFMLLLVIPLLVIGLKKKSFSWPFSIFLLAFMTNWVCSFLIMGVAPLFPVDAGYFNPQNWPRICGFILGMHGSMMLVYRILCKAKTTEERLALSVLLYGFIGLFIEGVFELGASIQ